MKGKKHDAIVLLSGGMDSTTLLYAVKEKYTPLALILSYGQRHEKEIMIAQTVASRAGVDYQKLAIPFPTTGSSLLDKSSAIPQRMTKNIPSTYVPARNTVFISLAVSFAEANGVGKVFIGINAVDYSGYPDCRPEYVLAFNKLLKLATKSGIEGSPVRVEAPYINLSKSEIIKKGISLGVPYEFTWSCYKGERKPCGTCDSCKLRAKGFKEAGCHDPLLTKSGNK